MCVRSSTASGPRSIAHASQLDESWWSRIPPDVWSEVFGEESFIRVRDTTRAPVPEDDLFAGLR